MSGLEHYAFLRSIDDKWREHLMIMDELKEGIHLRAYGQKTHFWNIKARHYMHFKD